MRFVHSILLVTIFVILVGCAELIPTPGTGDTAGKLHGICSTIDPADNNILSGYYAEATTSGPLITSTQTNNHSGYIATPNEKSKIVKECKFKAANIYFSNVAWDGLTRVLASYTPDTAIRPSFNDVSPSRYVESFIIGGKLINSNQAEYAVLRFNGKVWQKRLIANAQ